MINFDEFEMANEGATTHVVPIVAEVPQDIDDSDLQADSQLELAILPLRNVVLFPDNGKLAEWSAKGRILRPMFKTLSIVDIMERPDTLQRWKLNGGDDIGDLILACNLDPKHLQIELKEL